MLSDDEKRLVNLSFMKVALVADQAAHVFYERLFEIAPETRALFAKTDMRNQGRKLMQTLATAVSAVYQLETIAPVLRDLGRRHIAYGVQRDQYELVGQALLHALEQALGADYTEDVHTAWTKLYRMLADLATEAYPT